MLQFQPPTIVKVFGVIGLSRPRVPLPPLASFTLPLPPADVASLRETGSVDRYTPRGPVSAVLSHSLLMLSLMAPRVCTLVLSSFPLFS